MSEDLDLGGLTDGARVELGDGFVTAFDPPPAPLTTQRPLVTSTSESLAVADMFVQGRRALGRFARSPAVLAVEIEAMDAPLVLDVGLRFDETSRDWWRDRVGGIGRAAATALSRDPIGNPLAGHPDGVAGWMEPEGPRFVRVRADGAEESYAIGITGDDAGADSRVVCTTIALPDGHDGGLVVIEFTDAPEPAREWSMAARSSVVGAGLEFVRLRSPGQLATIRSGSTTIDAGSAAQHGMLATGDWNRGTRRGLRDAPGGLVVVHDEPPRTVGLAVTPQWQRQVGGGTVGDLIQRVTARRLTEECEDLVVEAEEIETGALVTVRKRHGSYVLRLPTAGPMGEPVDWQVRGFKVTPDSPAMVVDPKSDRRRHPSIRRARRAVRRLLGG